jgi:hypothetical protein
MAADRDARIRERAHAIWEREGRQHGQHDRHWAQAVAEIDAEDAQARQDAAKEAAPTKDETAKGGGKRSLTDAAVEAVTRVAGAALNAAAESVTGGKRGGTKKATAEGATAKSTTAKAAPKRAASASGAATTRKTSTGTTTAGKPRTGGLDRTAAANKPAARGTKKGR